MKKPRFAVLSLAAASLQSFREETLLDKIMTYLHQNTEKSFRLLPSATFFRPCRGLFRGTFCNFVARNDKIILK